MRILCFILFFFFVGVNSFSQTIDPDKYLATLQFDDCYQDFFKGKQEQLFPISFLFNTQQDGNADGKINTEDACENIVRYAIGDSIYGAGRTGLASRGPNDQRPAVYFHFVKSGGYNVYEYWLYYADNDYMNDHEHDWEKYFIYVKDNIPLYVFISEHKKFNFFSWQDIPKDEGHAVIGVYGGSHAMDNRNQRGVEIKYNGAVAEKSGKLDRGDGKTFPWRIYTNDVDVKGAISYIQQPDCFFNGDPVYSDIPRLSSSNEYSDCSEAPWKRMEWDNPPAP